MVRRRRDAEKKERRAERHMLLGIKYNCCYCLLLSVAHSWCSAAGLGSGGSPRHDRRPRGGENIDAHRCNFAVFCGGLGLGGVNWRILTPRSCALVI